MLLKTKATSDSICIFVDHEIADWNKKLLYVLSIISDYLYSASFHVLFEIYGRYNLHVHLLATALTY